MPNWPEPQQTKQCVNWVCTCWDALNVHDVISFSLTHWNKTTEHPYIQYVPRNMHTVFALLCFVVVIHRLIFPYPSGLLHWHCGNLTIAPVPEKQPWWIWINTSCEFIMNDCITTTKQSTTKPCAYFLGYTIYIPWTYHDCSRSGNETPRSVWSMNESTSGIRRSTGQKYILHFIFSYHKSMEIVEPFENLTLS